MKRCTGWVTIIMIYYGRDLFLVKIMKKRKILNYTGWVTIIMIYYGRDLFLVKIMKKHKILNYTFNSLEHLHLNSFKHL
jgi:hypothetical protein